MHTHYEPRKDEVAADSNGVAHGGPRDNPSLKSPRVVVRMTVPVALVPRVVKALATVL
jgi:hypothetical protein